MLKRIANAIDWFYGQPRYNRLFMLSGTFLLIVILLGYGMFSSNDYTPVLESCGNHYHLVFPEASVMGIYEDGSTIKATYVLNVIVDTDSAVCAPGIFEAARVTYFDEFVALRHGNDAEQALSKMTDIVKSYIDGATVIEVRISDQRFDYDS